MTRSFRADQSDGGRISADHHTPQIQLDPLPKLNGRQSGLCATSHFKYLPTSISYFSYPDRNQHPADSNGCAAGNTLGEGIVQGFLELVERDSYAIWWYTRSQRTEVDLDQFDDPYIRDLRVQLAETGRRLWVLDITSDLGIPSYVAFTHWMENSQDSIEFGSGAHFDPQIALLRAMTELSQFLSIGLMGGRSPEGLDYHGSASPPAFRLKDHPYLTPAGGSVETSYASSKFNELDKRDQVMACVDLARKHGLDFLVLDQTRPDIEVPVVRVIVPGLRHFYPRFAPGRLYDVPGNAGVARRSTFRGTAQSISPQDLMGVVACVIPIPRAGERAAPCANNLVALGSTVTSGSKRTRTAKFSPASIIIRLIRAIWRRRSSPGARARAGLPLKSIAAA